MTQDLTRLPHHSAMWFGDSRDYWWNEDFLALLASRWRLAEKREVLDVGCGVGHWGQIIGRFLASDARMVGIDREPEWIRIAKERAAGDSRRSFVVGTVESLPFEDNRFDLTTCQTVLIHLPDPATALREMIRVTRPGGLIAVVEPNNLAGWLVLDSFGRHDDPDRVLETLRFQMLCELGLRRLGQGSGSLGDRVPEMFVEAGLKQMQVFTNDKAGAILPPYDGPEQRSYINELERQVERQIGVWPRERTLQLFLAGGGHEQEFEGLWQKQMERLKKIVEYIRQGHYVAPGGAISYCVSGLKP